MVETTSRSDALGNALVCRVPCSIYGTDDYFVCVRHSDGAAIPIKKSEAQLLSVMSTAKSVNAWLDILCRRAIHKRLNVLKASKCSILGRVLEWGASLTKSANGIGSTARYDHLPLYKTFSAEVMTLIDRGLVAPVVTSEQNIIHSTQASTNCRITTLGIPTCGRSEYLSQCVRSFSDNLCAHGRNDAAILVIDDSADEVSESRNRDVITASRISGGTPIQFVAHRDREQLIATLLSKDAAPPEVLEFALDAQKLLTTEGCVRNTLMLLTAGQYILQTDDDTSCSYVSAHMSNSRVAISASADPYQTYFFADHQSNVECFPPSSSVDSFGIHEQMLGKHLPHLLLNNDSVVWGEINPHTLLGPQAPETRIDLTVTGMSGDPGTSSLFGIVAYAPAETIHRMYSSPTSYHTANTVREVLRLVPEPTISRRSIFQAMSFGINNTRLQPPFFPLGRNLDGAFAYLYSLSDQGALIGHIPFAITHQSEPTRKYDGRLAGRVCELQLTDVLQLCVGSISCSDHPNLNQALKCVGEQLVSLGSISMASFRSLLQGLYVQSRLTLLSYLDGLMAHSYPCDQKWLDDIRQISKDVRTSILGNRSIVPTRLSEIYGSDEEALAKAQWCIWMYGRLLLHWEDIYCSAADILRLR